MAWLKKEFMCPVCKGVVTRVYRSDRMTDEERTLKNRKCETKGCINKAILFRATFSTMPLYDEFLENKFANIIELYEELDDPNRTIKPTD